MIRWYCKSTFSHSTSSYYVLKWFVSMCFQDGIIHNLFFIQKLGGNISFGWFFKIDLVTSPSRFIQFSMCDSGRRNFPKIKTVFQCFTSFQFYSLWNNGWMKPNSIVVYFSLNISWSPQYKTITFLNFWAWGLSFSTTDNMLPFQDYRKCEASDLKVKMSWYIVVPLLLWFSWISQWIVANKIIKLR